MNALKAMRIINNKFDRQVQKSIRHTERVANLRVQCRPGCNHCCHFLTMASLLEAWTALEQLGVEAMMPLVPGLVADAKLLADKTTTIDSYSQLRQPCKLLRDGRCSVYENRPLVCRSHVSFSPPEECKDPDGKTWMLEAAHPLCGHFTAEMHRNSLPAAQAPLQYQLLVVLHIERHEDMAEYERMKKTAAFNFEQSVVAWEHLLDTPVSDEHRKRLPARASIYPIWEHFE